MLTPVKVIRAIALGILIFLGLEMLAMRVAPAATLGPVNRALPTDQQPLPTSAPEFVSMYFECIGRTPMLLGATFVYPDGRVFWLDERHMHGVTDIQALMHYADTAQYGRAQFGPECVTNGYQEPGT